MRKRSVFLAIFVAFIATVLLTTRSLALSISTAPVIFPRLVLTGYDQVLYGETQPWQIDASEELGGWNVTISATNFENEYGGVIYVSNLTFRLLAEQIVFISGDEVLPISTQNDYISLSETPLRFISAENETGVGVYQILPEFRLFIPAQAYAGNYTSTLTVSINAGP